MKMLVEGLHLSNEFVHLWEEVVFFDRLFDTYSGMLSVVSEEGRDPCRYGFGVIRSEFGSG